MSTQTADEFVSAIADFDRLPAAVQTDLLAYFSIAHASAAATAGSLSDLREALHLAAQSRLPQYLSEQTKKKGGKPGKYVKTAKGYLLERAYSKQLQAEHLGRPASKNISSSLRGTLSAIGDQAVKSYLEETISCFEYNLLRSAIVMSWCVAYGLVRAWLFRNHLQALNTEMATWKVPVKITKLDDFQDLNEATILDTARKVKVLTKEQHKTLKQLLDERNSYAHPTSKAITPSMAEAHIERVIQDVLPHFG